MIHIYRREFCNYFRTPVGYVFLTILLASGGILFFSNNLYGGYGDLDTLFYNLSYLLMLLTPVLTMRLLSEERKTKTDQLVLTSPVSLSAVVVGKYLAAMTVLLIGTAAMLIYVAIIGIYGRLHPGLLLTNSLGFLLLGGIYLAIGILISSMTESQLNAALLTFGANLLIQFLETVALQLSKTIYPMRLVLSVFSLYRRYDAFTIGLISPASFVYYLAFISVLLFFTVRILDQRRWR